MIHWLYVLFMFSLVFINCRFGFNDSISHSILVASICSLFGVSFGLNLNRLSKKG